MCGLGTNQHLHAGGAGGRVGGKSIVAAPELGDRMNSDPRGFGHIGCQVVVLFYMFSPLFCAKPPVSPPGSWSKVGRGAHVTPLPPRPLSFLHRQHFGASSPTFGIYGLSTTLFSSQMKTWLSDSGQKLEIFIPFLGKYRPLAGRCCQTCTPKSWVRAWGGPEFGDKGTNPIPRVSCPPHHLAGQFLPDGFLIPRFPRRHPADRGGHAVRPAKRCKKAPFFPQILPFSPAVGRLSLPNYFDELN